MATWNVTSEQLTVTVQSDNWLGALASALPLFHLPAARLDRFACVMNADGSVDVQEPIANVHLRLRLAGKSSELLDMPWSSPLLGDTSEGAVALYERCSEISEADTIRGACGVALSLAREYSPANAGAVLLTGNGGEQLEFMSAFGPQSRKVIGTLLPTNHGIAGFIKDFPVGIIIRDVLRDVRFEGAVDRTSGYKTRSVLAVPVRTPDGPIYGCMELLNATDGFTPANLESTETIANSLGAWLHSAAAGQA